jgi:hypothetical protein
MLYNLQGSNLSMHTGKMPEKNLNTVSILEGMGRFAIIFENSPLFFRDRGEILHRERK